MNQEQWRLVWKKEEEAAHIQGWDFSPIDGRYEVERDLPWNYEKIARQYLRRDLQILDCDTGGGEFLLSLNHPFGQDRGDRGISPQRAVVPGEVAPPGHRLQSVRYAFANSL